MTKNNQMTGICPQTRFRHEWDKLQDETRSVIVEAQFVFKNMNIVLCSFDRRFQITTNKVGEVTNVEFSDHFVTEFRGGYRSVKSAIEELLETHFGELKGAQVRTDHVCNIHSNAFAFIFSF